MYLINFILSLYISIYGAIENGIPSPYSFCLLIGFADMQSYCVSHIYIVLVMSLLVR